MLQEQAVASLAPIERPLRRVGDRFADAGWEIALVGGPVRDALLERLGSDTDLPALSGLVRRCLKKLEAFWKRFAGGGM